MAARTYLTLADILYIHDEQLHLYGGAVGTRDEGLVLSALLRPQTGYYADVIEEAAALWESLAMNHGFVDDNKRTAFAATVVFLALNGVELTGSEDQMITFIYEHLEGSTFRKPVLEDWLNRHTQPL
jgi:death-on-curing protein